MLQYKVDGRLYVVEHFAATELTMTINVGPKY